MPDYLGIEQALKRPGLRLVLTAGFPGPWGESAKNILHVKRLAYAPVRQRAGESDAVLAAWTGQISAPVAAWNDERPRSGWAEILFLCERLEAEPPLVPANPEERAEKFGLSHEICGEQATAGRAGS